MGLKSGWRLLFQHLLRRNCGKLLQKCLKSVKKTGLQAKVLFWYWAHFCILLVELLVQAKGCISDNICWLSIWKYCFTKINYNSTFLLNLFKILIFRKLFKFLLNNHLFFSVIIVYFGKFYYEIKYFTQIWLISIVIFTIFVKFINTSCKKIHFKVLTEYKRS